MVIFWHSRAAAETVEPSFTLSMGSVISLSFHNKLTFWREVVGLSYI